MKERAQCSRDRAACISLVNVVLAVEIADTRSRGIDDTSRNRSSHAWRAFAFPMME